MMNRPARPERGLRGFSLIELIVALAVVAVLVAVAAPSYGTYVRRSLVSEALVATGPVKAAIAEEVTLSPGQGGSRPPTVQSVGPTMAFTPSRTTKPTPTLVAERPSPQIESVWRAGTIIVVNFDPAFAPDGASRYSVALAGTIGPEGTVRWTCRTGDAALGALGSAAAVGVPTFSALPSDWAPSDCR